MDVVVIGAGHNGLTAAIRLARAGLDVLVVDKLPWPGGMAGYHILAGRKVGVGAYVVGVMPEELREELGLSIYVPDPIAVYELDGEYVRWWRDPKKRVEEFRERGLGDEAAAFIEKLASMNRALRRLFHKPPAEEELRADPEAAELVEKTARDILSQYLPQEYWPMFIYEHLLDQPAFYLAYFNPPEGWGYPEAGGERGIWALAESLYRKALEAGARVVLGASVEKILVKNGAVEGVLTSWGKAIEARAVLSTASPIHTLLDLVGPEHLDEEAERRLRAAAAPPAGPYKANVVLAREARLREGLQQYRESILQLPFGEAVVHGDYVTLVGEPDLEALESYVLNLRDLKALEVWGPAEYTATFNAAGAYVNHLPLTRDFLLCRPACGWGYKTPIRGLYLGGAGTWPGGQITGVPGWNAAGRVLEDLRRT
jgi:phytoene dehydrogenase-like protein